MSDTFDLVLRNGQVVTSSGLIAADIGVRDGRIAALGRIGAGQGGETVDATGLHILPGVIDAHVHFREPGLTHKEDFETGSRAAVLGGVTTVFEMPNSDPVTTTAERLLDKLDRAKGRMACDYAFYIGASSENASLLGELERLPGCAGVKAFMGASTGSLLLADEEGLMRALTSGRRRMSFHAEDEDRLQARKALALPGRPETHPVWRDAECARLAGERLMRLARAARRQVHVLHATTAQEMELYTQHRDIATVEVTANHLTMVAPDCYERLGAYAQMNPPVRDEPHRAALWRAIGSGLIDAIGSDHAPHVRAEKDGTYPQTPSGMPGVQTLVPVLLNHVAEGRITLQRLADLTSAGPARIYGVAGKGRIAAGYDADFTLVDLKARKTIRNEDMASRCGWTQFDGMEITGWPIATIVRGRIAMRDGAVESAPAGAPARFQ
ncbi:L-hydantoinase [Alphaproteobacteria bacterium SO-S41]|nr:L-hydantoinase [Alphaproteobacteria bacterium SO-S41]